MVVLDYEINLSKTEYLYYLECPQKFRLHRILNPIPNKLTFMNAKRSSTSYFLRRYQDDNLDGIVNHSFFETFHKKYWNRITEPCPPEEITNNHTKSLYWDYQQRKYYEDTEHWIPIHTELPLMTERQRGIIDCVELCNNRNGLRIIDYKPEPNPSDKQSLIFYLNLCNEYRAENKESDELIFDVLEIGCYYYRNGIEKIFNLNIDERLHFKERYQQIIEKISREEFPQKNVSCENCSLKIICRIEEGRI